MFKGSMLSYQRTCQNGETTGAPTLEKQSIKMSNKMQNFGNTNPTSTYFDALAGNKTSSSKIPPTVQALEEKRTRAIAL